MGSNLYCLVCGKKIKTKGAKKFCSSKCYGKTRIGHIPWNKGLKYSEEMKSCLDMSGLAKGRYKGKDMSVLKGDKNPMRQENIKRKVHYNPNVQATYFKKGHLPWTKGMKGIHLSPETEFKKGQLANEKHPFWKGNNVGYHALHKWLDRNFGNPTVCQNCNSEENIQWASKNYKYTRSREDWIHLCFKCHRKYDSKNGWGKASKKYPEIKK